MSCQTNPTGNYIPKRNKLQMREFIAMCIDVVSFHGQEYPIPRT